MINFQNDYTAETKQKAPMEPIKMEIDGLKFDCSTNVITFPSKTYRFSFVYEALHNASDSTTLGSYCINFSIGITLSKDSNQLLVYRLGD